MVAVFLISIVIVAAILSWFLQRYASQIYARYRNAFKKEASVRLSEFFLFLDPAQLWFVNLIVCGFIVIFIYLVSGSVWVAATAGALTVAAPQ